MPGRISADVSVRIIRPSGTLLLLEAYSEGPSPHLDFFRYIGMEDGPNILIVTDGAESVLSPVS